MTEPQLKVDGLVKHFPLRRSFIARLGGQKVELVKAVDDVDLVVAKGEVHGLVGETGCGKSTLARCIAGLYEPTSGEIRLDGRLLSASRHRETGRHIQMVFQDPYSSLNPRMTVAQTVGEILRVLRRVPRSELSAKVNETLSLVGFPVALANVYPRQLSGGLRQRVSIARALAAQPEILLADEAVSALDVSVQATILNLLADLRQQLGLTILLITHDMAVVRHVSDQVAVMYLGRIVERGPAEQLFTDPRHPYSQGLISAVPRLKPGADMHSPAVTGDPPSPIRLPSGCRYHPRCQHAQDLCRTESPTLVPISGQSGHEAACHFASEMGATRSAASTTAQASTEEIVDQANTL